MTGGTSPAWQRLLPGQHAMLTPCHSGPSPLLVSSGELSEPPEAGALEGALGLLAARHPVLRTVFAYVDGGWRRRVFDRWVPRLATCLRRHAPGDDPVAAIHATLLADGRWRVGDPSRRPPVELVLTDIEPTGSGGPHRQVLSLVAHRALLDRPAVGLVWRDLIDALQDSAPRGSAYAPVPSRSTDGEPTGRERTAGRCARRAAELAGVPQVLPVPSDRSRPAEQDFTAATMLVGLSAQSRHAVTALSEALGIGPTTVLLCVWALVLGRRTATDQLLIGVTVPVVPGTAAAPVAGPATHVVPVHCRLDDHASVADVLRRTAAALDIALAARDVPMEDLIAELGVADDPQRLPLVQVTLDAYELLPPPGEAPAPGIRTDYGGGSPFDLTLGVRWEGGPQLALEYALAAVAPEEAADLADSLDTALTELAREPAAPLSSVRTISSAQQRRFQVLRERPAAAPPGDLWSLVVSRAEADPARIAVRDADARRSLSYRQLVVAAEQQSAELAAAGVGQDDHVVLAMPRSAAEIVAVLAVLRLGAAYVPNDLSSPDQRLRTILQPVAPRAVLGPPAEADRIRRLAPEGCAVPVVVDPWAAGTRLDLPPPAVHQPERVAYVAFTSGSTGAPKGVRVPHRAVSRLVRDVDYVRCGRGERFLRFAPLAFDASTLEIFAPLVNGGTIEVFPDALPSPTDLARFLTERRVSVLWLTAGLFRILVDLAPQAFSTVRQVLTGGDVVPSEQVRRLLESYPGLRVTNGYGPTENTTFTTVHHVDDPYDVDDPLPIGTPVPGTDVLVLDHLGRLLPPGAIGELYTGGQGLALDYLAAPEETAAAMGRTAPDTGERLYRTGDVVRWDARDRLLFLGRRDHQVKIRGFRVELEEIRRRLAEHPAVHDAVVVVVGADVDSRQLLAAVVSDHGPDLLPLLREYAGETLPRYAVPTLWAAVSRIPVTPNGKVDRRALEEAAVRLQEVAVGPRARDRPPVSPRRSPPSNALRSSPSAPSALG